MKKSNIIAAIIISMFLGNNEVYAQSITERQVINLGDDVTYSDVSFTVNSPDDLGGGFNNSGNLTVENSAFTNNEALTGGAIFNNASGVVDIKGATAFNNNTAIQKGGAIYNTGIITIGDGSSFTGNETTWTGIIGGEGENDCNSFGGAIWNGGTLNLGNDITFTDNKGSQNNSDSNFSTHGSDLYNFSGNVTIGDNLTVTRTENYAAPRHDCSVYLREGSLTIGNNASISGVHEAMILSSYMNGNVTIGDDLHIFNAGNGIINYGGANINIGKNALFENITWNRAFENVAGAGAYTFGDGLTVQNNINMGPNPFGIIYNIGGASMTFNGSANFLGNRALDNAGVFQNFGNLTFEGETVFSGNIAGLDAGALRNRSASANSIFNDKVTFSNNSAVTQGGAVINQGTVTFNGAAEFTGNMAGALISDSGSVTGFDSSSSAKGGAIYNQIQSSSPIINFNSNADFKDNKAGYGGAIYNENTINFNSNSTYNFENNSANFDGGAIYTNSDMSLANAVFTANSALNGGAIYNNGAQLTLTNSDFTNNTASTSGGAIYNNNGTLTINSSSSDVTFSGNTANGSANDIYNAGILNLNAENGTTISLNGGITGSNTGTLSAAGEGTVSISNNLQNQTGSVTSKYFTLLNADLSGSDLNVASNVILNTIDDKINNYAPSRFQAE